MEMLFEQLMEDNTSGSGTIMDKTLDVLLHYADKNPTVDTGILLQTLDELYSAFPNFALLFHFVQQVKKKFSLSSGTIDSNDLKHFLTEYKKRYDGVQRMVSKRFMTEVDVRKKKVLVHSNSSSVSDLFFLLSERNLFPQVWQTVSSPAGEGAIQAGKLAESGFKVNLFHEDALSLFVKNIDFAVFGADVLLNRSFVNKIGTYSLCLMLRQLNKPVYVLAEERKKIDESDLPAAVVNRLVNEQEKPEYEFPFVSHPNVAIHNYYFEQIPLSLVTKVFI